MEILKKLVTNQIELGEFLSNKRYKVISVNGDCVKGFEVLYHAIESEKPKEEKEIKVTKGGKSAVSLW